MSILTQEVVDYRFRVKFTFVVDRIVRIDMKIANSIILILLTLFALGRSDTDQAAGTIIQYRNDRLYFDQGEESNLFRGSPFIVIRGADTLFASKIEFSYDGISMSEPTGGFFDTLPWQDLELVLIPARYDSSAILRVATDYSLNEFMSTGFITQPEDSLTDVTYNSGIEWIYSDDRIELLHDFRTGRSDLLVSFNDYGRQLASANVVWSPAPYIAVLMPNLSSERNRAAALTTSLYYRFDDHRLGLYFDGDRVAPVYSFRAGQESGNRMFEYDEDRGRQLFKRVSTNPRRLAVYVGHPALLRTADYFRDILARDRCRMTLVDSRKEADIYLEFVPFDIQNPAGVMACVLDILENDSPDAESYSSIIQTCRRQLQWSISDPDSARTAYHLRLCNRQLIDDLGVFPLFRPAVHVTSQPDIRGINTTADGRIDFTTARRVVVSDIIREEKP